MGLPRGLKPAAGALLGLGTGFTVISLSDADSEARRWVTAARGEMLLAALHRRLHQEEAGAASTPRSKLVPATRALSHRFYVVSGPDEHLTLLGRDRVSHMPAVAERRGGSGDDHQGNGAPPRRRRRRIARLVVPYGCALGTGQFSLLMEQQMLLRPPGEQGEHNKGGSESSAEDGFPTEPGGVGISQDDQEQERSTWDDGSGNIESEQKELLPPPSTAQTVHPISTWESLMLRATRAILDGKQLDRSAIWALERALSGGEGIHTRNTPAASSSRPGDSENDDGRNQEATPPVADPAPSAAGGGCAFVLEIGQPASQQTRAGTGGRDADEGGTGLVELCGELVTWGWSLVSRNLGSVLVSSSNPWVLAELQQTLRHAASEREDLAEEQSEERQLAEHSQELSPETSPREVVVVRVALPSAAERNQAVLAVAGELGVDDRLSAADVSMLAELTGGRRAGLLDVLERTQQTSSEEVVPIAAACQAAVDDQARALAKAWGLLSHQGVCEGSDAADDEVVAVRSPAGGSNGGAGGAGVAGAGGEKRREEWAPLWGAMGMLSVPAVTVGAVAAGAAPSPSPPPGSAHPAELLEECALDGQTLLRLTREGWLELSPAAPPMSGTALEDPGEGPPSTSTAATATAVTVHLADVPLEFLSRGVDRSFVSAPPLRLAAFRRLLDHRRRHDHRRPTARGAVGPQTIPSRGAGGGGVDGLGGAAAVGVHGEMGVTVEEWEGGVADQELERAGCLMEAAVLSREHGRQEATLSEDGRVLASNWAELDGARRDLESSGKDEDTSDGEWAEVQLELIRQERAVYSRALEMRARRGRVDGLRRDVFNLERHAELLLSSLLQEAPPPPSQEHSAGNFSPSLSSREDTPAPAGRNNVGVETGDYGQVSPVGFPEEMVIRDVERGVRLVPLRRTDTRKAGGDDGCGAVGRGVGIGSGGGGGAEGSPRGRGYGVGRLMRWVRGSS